MSLDGHAQSLWYIAFFQEIIFGQNMNSVQIRRLAQTVSQLADYDPVAGE